MEHRDKRVRAEGVPGVNIRYGLGRFGADVTYYRTLRNGNSEEVVIQFSDLDPEDLRCLARSLRLALAAWGRDWHATDKVLKGEQ